MRISMPCELAKRYRPEVYHRQCPGQFRSAQPGEIGLPVTCECKCHAAAGAKPRPTRPGPKTPAAVAVGV